MRNSKYLIIFLIAFLPAKLIAQDITGLWKGTLYNDSTKKYYRYEIGISEEKGKLSGFSHTFFLVDDKEFYGVKKVKIRKTDGKIIVEDAGLIANNYPEAPAKGVRQLNVLTLEVRDSIMTLSGPFSTNRTKEYSSLTGTINLQRKNDFWQSALVPHLQELGLSTNLSFVKKEADLAKEKEAAEKIAAQKEMAAMIALQETGKEPPLKKEEVKPELKKSEPSKEIVSNISLPKKEIKNEIKSKPESEETIKEITTGTATFKSEETKPDNLQPNKPSKAEAGKEVKSNESKKINASSAESTANIKPTEMKPVVIRSNAPAAEVASRTNVVQQTVYFTSDSLQISLYDNGEVDGDTVSVLMNGKIIMAREGLSTNAVRKTIYAGQLTDSIELIMYAENLGTIAPNTGLLVVHDGKSIYEIRFSGDLKKNAAIILKRRKN
ncbi:MAG: hypothetical protein ABI741_00505 [Ferruginibacter sp.]